MCHDYHGFKWQKIYISLILNNNLTFNTLCGSFDCVLIHVECDYQCKSWNRLPRMVINIEFTLNANHSKI
jgi:hypothetical protein